MLNDLEEEIVSREGSAMFGPPGPEIYRTGPGLKQRDLGVGWLLYAFVRAARPKIILEIGTGGSSACLLWGLKHNGFGHLHTCDVFLSGGSDDVHRPNDFYRDAYGRPMNHCKANFLRDLNAWDMEALCTLHHMSSVELLKMWTRKINMLVVDGDHSLEGIQNDVGFLHFLCPGGYAMFHDFIACLHEVGKTVLDFVEASDEWAMIVEPNMLSMAIVQRKYSLDPARMFTAGYLTKTDNPNNALTSIHLTDPRNCDIVKPWNGHMFPETPAAFHCYQWEGEEKAKEIMKEEAQG